MVGRAARCGNREILRDFEVEGFVFSERDQRRNALQQLIPETSDDVSGASRSGWFGRSRWSLAHSESCQVVPPTSLAIAGQHAAKQYLLFGASDAFRLRRLSGVLRAFVARWEGRLRVDLTRSPSLR